jgi:solute carrier family 25 S-adenosylmethionine transporter 26
MKRATLAIEGAADESGKKTKKKRALGKRQTAIIGGVAGGLTGLVTTPFDVSRTAHVCASSMGIDLKTHPKGLAGLKRLKERFGMSFFFRGAAPRALEIGLGGVIYFTVIETTRRYFESSSRETKDAKVLKTV